MNRLILTLAVVFAVISLIGLMTLATTSISAPGLQNGTFTFPNNTEIYGFGTLGLNVTTNSTGLAYNVSVYSNNTFVAWLYNSTTSSARNGTLITWPSLGDGSLLRDVRIAVNDSPNVYNWTNGTYFIKINERAPQSVLITDNSGLKNNSYYSSYTGFTYNVSLNATESTCQVFVNGVANATMSNQTGVNTVFWNTTQITLDDTPYTQQTQITYRCQDAYGNSTWYNSTVNGGIFIDIDRTNPSVSNQLKGFINTSNNIGSALNLTFNVTDANLDNPFVTIYFPDGSNSTKNATLDFGTNVSQYEINITGSDLTQDGKYQIEPNGLDLAGNKGKGTNITLVREALYTSTWNLVTSYKNLTISQFASEFPNVTYVSTWNASAQAFVTFQIGLSTNANVYINSTLNVTLVQVNQNVSYVRERLGTYEFTPNVTLYTYNGTLGSWNLVGVVSKKILNQTLYGSDLAFNNLTVGGGTSANVTYASWFNQTSGLFCSSFRGFLATSCPGFYTNTTTIPEGSGVWLMVNNNLTLNRSAW